MSDQTVSELLDRSVEHLPVSDPPLADLVRRGRAARHRRRRALLVGAGATVLALTGGGVAAQQWASHRASSGQAPDGSAPPAPPEGMKWVGIDRTVVAVPRDWPVVPGIYCEGLGPADPYVTLTAWRVVVSCPAPNPTRGEPEPAPASIDVEADGEGRFAARLDQARRTDQVTQATIDASRSTLPAGWLAVPAGEPTGGVGWPTLTSEIAALKDAGFQVEVRSAPPAESRQSVSTVPEIGTPARAGSTVVVLDHGTRASSATLTGRLLWVGGPAPGTPVPHGGMIRAVSLDGSVDETAPAGEDGRWTLQLPPGTYELRATSPGYLSAAGRPDACAAARPVTVGADEAVSVRVFCQLR